MRISCAHNTLRASVGLNTTQSPWNLGYGSLKVTGNRTLGYIIHDLLLVELFNVEYYRDRKMWVRGHSRSLKVVPFETWKLGYGFLFAFHSNYGRIFSHFGDIQRQRMAWPWNLGLGMFKVIKNGAVRQTMYDFLLVHHCNYSSIMYHLRVIWHWIISWPWKLA